MRQFYIYTDGSSKDSENVAGWGSVVYERNSKFSKRMEFNGIIDTKVAKKFNFKINSNSAELLAAINTIKLLPKKSIINVYTDSGYLVWGGNKGVDIWPNNKWVSKNGFEIDQQYLWEEIIKLKKKYKSINFNWIKGHRDNLDNRRADHLAYLGRNNKIIDHKKQSNLYEVIVDIYKENDNFFAKCYYENNCCSFFKEYSSNIYDFNLFSEYIYEKIVIELELNSFNFATIYSKNKCFKSYCKKNKCIDFAFLMDKNIYPYIFNRYKNFFLI